MIELLSSDDLDQYRQSLIAVFKRHRQPIVVALIRRIRRERLVYCSLMPIDGWLGSKLVLRNDSSNQEILVCQRDSASIEWQYPNSKPTRYYLKLVNGFWTMPPEFSERFRWWTEFK